jgi:hypothetical protein
MKTISIPIGCLIVLFVLTGSARVAAQTDRDLKQKQSELKGEYGQAQEKNQIVKSAALDKSKARSSRGSKGGATGYNYTQIKGFQLDKTAFEDRIDKLFNKAGEVGAFEDVYRVNGTFSVPGKKNLGNASMQRVEVYYVEATPEEQETLNVNPYDVIEIRVIKQEQPPAAESTEGGGEETDLMFLGGGGGETETKSFTLAGEELWNVIRAADESLYDDILTRRKQDPKLDFSPGFLYEKRGPFIVMLPTDLETSTSRFIDFWNPDDTARFAKTPILSDSPGPLVIGKTPVLFADNMNVSKIRVENKGKEQIKITDAKFIGDNADQFRIKTNPNILLDPKGGTKEKDDIYVEYIGGSDYQTRSQFSISAEPGGMNQKVDVVANAGKFPADIAVLDASLDKVELRSPGSSKFAPDWKLTYRIGDDEIGLPRWSSGMSSLSVGYKHQMYVGVVMPMNMNAPDLPSPLAYNTRLLSSPMGYTIGFDFTFGFPFALGGNMTVTNKFDGQEAYRNLKLIGDRPLKLDDPDFYNDFFNIGALAQVYYPIMFKDREDYPNISFRIDIGGSLMQIQRNHVVVEGETQKLDVRFTDKDAGHMFNLEKFKDVADVFVRLTFINLGAKNNYSLGVQYFSGRMMADAWLELTHWLRVEAKYSFLLRGREMWEQESSYFLVTPRFRFGFPSIFN